ncbi:FixH family protein [Abyssalbus ytuae]|uniref:FixH family protein n=1 Tax=Abyssalbus ytuae TaxID=2926907 RepID=A0A9E6ZW81_9FLAO|nr:FixH family protein [Abyssalbus ytuae]UOB18913.1 FixH family protein [Abyssalbus ytuae]
MKINWGTGIVLAFIGFISFIMYFVIKVNTNDKYNHDLVTEEYYKKELAFQQQLDKQKKAKKAGIIPTIHKSNEGLVVSFPANTDYSKISGNVFLYRPSNKQLDFEIPISLSTSSLLIPNKHLLDGRWNIEIEWIIDGEEYFYKEELTF